MRKELCCASQTLICDHKQTLLLNHAFSILPCRLGYSSSFLCVKRQAMREESQYYYLVHIRSQQEHVSNVWNEPDRLQRSQLGRPFGVEAWWLIPNFQGPSAIVDFFIVFVFFLCFCLLPLKRGKEDETPPYLTFAKFKPKAASGW